MTTISWAASSHEELIIGCRLAATSSALATRTSGETLMPSNSGSDFSRAVAVIVSVMSICRNSVTCGAVKALAAIAAAVCLRTPRIAIRSSRGSEASRRSATWPRSAGCAPGASAAVTAAAAA